MDNNVIVVGVGKPYDFENENGERVKGAKVYFFIENYVNDGELGYVPRSVSVSSDVYNRLSGLKFPFLAEVVTQKRFARNGFVDKVVDFKFIDHFDFLNGR